MSASGRPISFAMRPAMLAHAPFISASVRFTRTAPAHDAGSSSRKNASWSASASSAEMSSTMTPVCGMLTYAAKSVSPSSAFTYLRARNGVPFSAHLARNGVSSGT